MASLTPPGSDETTIRADLAALAQLAGPAPDVLYQTARRAMVRRRRRVASGVGAGVLAVAVVAAVVVPGAFQGSPDHPAVVPAARPSPPAPTRVETVPPFSRLNPWVYTLENWKRTRFANPCMSSILVGLATGSPPPTQPTEPPPPEPVLQTIAAAGGGRVEASTSISVASDVVLTVDGRAVRLTVRQQAAPGWLASGSEASPLAGGSVLELSRSGQMARVYRVDGTVWDVAYFAVPFDNPPEAFVQDTLGLVRTIDAAIPAVEKPVPGDIDAADLCPVPAAPPGQH
ncbi:hypothetical protein [Pseudofrankia inefficax]|uniref:Uncharacterized protein n=1 Tax=Pseudofrankia inefficax (strain DSM 45817 / CECT 9037 / DDB 130130 / EuI1c) TaxID=298654 RepID=E3JBP9_PSEI1|nr:hypothetical protein [Pseudofrankia inefficax]ADP81069.1 hypothetical protein FraEuI1c_3044 [Pseudofrankia inefficax]